MSDSDLHYPGPPPGYRRTISQTVYRTYPVARPSHILHPIESDPVNGYEPAYSAWNPQPIQAVFKNGPSKYGSSRSGMTSGMTSESISAPTEPKMPPEDPPEGPIEKKTETELPSGNYKA
ncbi:hypothetical protein L596_021561 [Steinernema carpocapsae]|uniref:Uncharacterized protein n=1 Tax=Steinernema carpocapsae TaxID=34508 RepID=A0A4U5MJX8_STECR|nr:hypothetical protein L596_021561 [Steinernema carpocapsae]